MTNRRHSCFNVSVESGQQPTTLTLDNARDMRRELSDKLAAAMMGKTTNRAANIFVPLAMAGDMVKSACKVFASRQLGDGSVNAARFFCLCLLKDACIGCQADEAFDFHSCRSMIPEFMARHFDAICHLFNLAPDRHTHDDIFEYLIGASVASSLNANAQQQQLQPVAVVHAGAESTSATAADMSHANIADDCSFSF
jgi:hypothetical protein